MDNNNLFNQGNQSGEQGQYQYQPQPQQQYQNSDGQYQQPYQQQPYQYQQSYQAGDDQFQKQQPYQPYQQNYGQYQQQSPYSSGSEVEEPVSFAEWMVTLLLLYIPCVNLIVALVWAFGSGTSRSKSNFAKAKLVWMVIGAVLGTIMFFLYFAAIMAYLEGGYY